LNRWLREMETLHPPPLAKGRRIRLRFMTQIKRRPPTFVLQVSQPEELGDDYLRYLTNRLRDDFGLPGVPIRLTMRKPRNPSPVVPESADGLAHVVCAFSRITRLHCSKPRHCRLPDRASGLGIARGIRCRMHRRGLSV